MSISSVPNSFGFHRGDRKLFAIGYRSVSLRRQIRLVPSFSRQFLLRKSPLGAEVRAKSSPVKREGMSEKYSLRLQASTLLPPTCKKKLFVVVQSAEESETP